MFGLSYVGTSTAACPASYSRNICGVDVDLSARLEFLDAIKPVATTKDRAVVP